MIIKNLITNWLGNGWKFIQMTTHRPSLSDSSVYDFIITKFICTLCWFARPFAIILIRMENLIILIYIKYELIFQTNFVRTNFNEKQWCADKVRLDFSRR